MENDEQKPVWKRIEYFSNMTIKLWLSKVTLGQSFKKEEIIKMVISNTIKGKSSFHFVVSYIIQYCATKTSWANTWKYPEATRQHLCSTLLLVTQNGLTLTVLDDLATFVQEENAPHNFYDECFQIKLLVHTKWIPQTWSFCHSTYLVKLHWVWLCPSYNNFHTQFPQFQSILVFMSK